MPTVPLAHASEVNLATAVEENLFALFRAVATLPGSVIAESERFSYHCASPSGAMFKSAWRAQLSADEVDTAIEQVIAWFHERGEDTPAWWFNGRPQPPDLRERLEAHGFELDYTAPGMAIDLKSIPVAPSFPDDFTIRPALDQKTLDDWAAVLSETYNFSRTRGRQWVEATLALDPENAPWRLYVGYWNGQPVATNMLFNGAGVVGLYCIGTIPEARGKGFGGAVTLKPLLDTRAEGYRYGVLFASEEGFPMYRRLGFHEVDILIGRYVRRDNPSDP